MNVRVTIGMPGGPDRAPERPASLSPSSQRHGVVGSPADLGGT